jgi:nucleoside-diphosphate-sugar epimerase
LHCLVTGAAGFIGSRLLEILLGDGALVTAVDNFDPFYPRSVKEANLGGVFGHSRLRFVADSPFEVINLGNNQPTRLMDMIRTIEDALNQKAILDFLPDQPGDVPSTFADICKARQLLNYEPRTSLSEGIARSVARISTTQACR